jgi:integrase
MPAARELVAQVPRSTPRKRGRPPAEYRRPDGTKVVGLSRQADGRWRISATGEVFFEPDEHLALARFERAMALQRGERAVDLPLPPQPDLGEALTSAARAGGTRLRVRLRANRAPEYLFAVDGDAFWAEVRRLLLEEPERVAQRTGVEWVARGANLPRETPSPTLKAVGDAYANKAGLSANEASRSRLFWKEFTKAVDVGTVRELTHDRVAGYELEVRGANLAPKSMLHRYSKVRTVLAYAIKRGIGVEDCRRALDVLAMLEVKDHTPLDPRPIGVEQFRAIHSAAVAAEDVTFSAMLLMALNGALYPGEAAALVWEEVDLGSRHVVTRRPKTGVSRIAVLWPETVKALKLIPRRGEHIFNTRVRSFTTFSVLDRWRKYRKSAGLPEAMVFSQVRDAAYSVALTVSLEQAKLLAGHRLAGATDHYVRRNPDLVAEACAAIRRAYAPFEQPKLEGSNS